MFDALSDRLEGIFTRVRNRGRLSEHDIDEVTREIRRALLEADVNVHVVRAFIDRLKASAIGADLSKSLSPGQQFVKIVHDELVETLGGQTGKLTMSPKPPTVVMLAGLQGSGKTTAAGKLARLLKSQGLQPLLVGADLQRPAAVEQLRVLAGRVDVPFFSDPSDPVESARGGIAEALRLGRNVVIVDTAGRLQIDIELMEELRDIRDAVQPHNTLLVVDAMTGQEAVNVATAFHEAVGLEGVILTKIDEFEPFHPDRMASRILGMGDVMTLIERAEAAFDDTQKAKAEEILREGTFTLEDFLDQMQQVKKMGSIQNVIGMLPGMPKEVRNAEIDDREITRIEAIIQSMTPAERRKPDLINGSRRGRIAKGAGVNSSDVNSLLKQFKQVQQMMRSMGGGRGKKGKRPKLPMGDIPGLPT